MMPPKPTPKSNSRKELQAALKALGIDGNFVELIDAAVRKDWDAQTFVIRLTRTEAFRTKFPGLISRGNLNPMLVQGKDVGITVQTLGQAIRAYETVWQGYTEIARNYGYGGISREKLATLLKAETSPDEFGTRLAAIQTVKTNPAAFDALKQQAKLAGVAFNEQDLFRFAAGTADRQFYDIYEAAQLQSQIGLTAQEARATAGAVGQPGTFTQSLDQTLSYVRENLATVGPELMREGISAAKLVKVMANPGAYTKEMETIAQAVATRQGMSRPVAGIYASRGTGGGLSLYQDEGASAYG